MTNFLVWQRHDFSGERKTRERRGKGIGENKNSEGEERGDIGVNEV